MNNNVNLIDDIIKNLEELDSVKEPVLMVLGPGSPVLELLKDSQVLQNTKEYERKIKKGEPGRYLLFDGHLYERSDKVIGG